MMDEEDWEFNPTHEIGGPLLSLDEMREAMEDEIGPEMDLEMWNICELQITCLFASQLTIFCYFFVQEIRLSPNAIHIQQLLRY